MSELNVTPPTMEATEMLKEILSEPNPESGEVITSQREDPSEDLREARTKRNESVESPSGPKMALPPQGGLGPKDSKTTSDSGTVVRGLSRKERTLPSKLRVYCHDHAVALVLKSLCENVPEAFPNYRTWEGPDIVPLIHARIQERGHIESLWPSIRMIMKDNRFNISWCARVIIAMTVWMVVWDVAPTLPCNTDRYDPRGRILEEGEERYPRVAKK